VLLLLAALLLSDRAAAQSIPSLSDAARVSMLTILPGDAVYSEFGHSAFRVRDPQRKIDRMYNYGTFAFGDPFFVPKFVYGQLDYYLSVVPYDAAHRHYERLGRPIIEQHLRLTAEQQNALFQFLEINARPANRMYRYDFLFDNCSTRIRDALESAVGDAVQFTGRPDPNLSFRHLLDPWVADRPSISVGFDLVLGTPTDRIATPREAMFLPVYLMEAFDHATIQADGTTQPLVARTDTTLWFEGYDATEQAFPWPRWLGWMAFVVGLGLTVRAARRADTRPGRWLDGTLLGLTGLAGCIMAFLWFISEHAVTNYNWNLLWAWPTHLIAAVLVWRRADQARWMRPYLGAAAGLALLTAIGWAFWPQDLHAAVLPFTLLLIVRFGWRAYVAAPRERVTAAGSFIL
jgi:hypothetical protein